MMIFQNSKIFEHIAYLLWLLCILVDDDNRLPDVTEFTESGWSTVEEIECGSVLGTLSVGTV